MTKDDLDPHAILHTLGLTDAIAVAPVQGGSDAVIWRVECMDGVYALRVFGKGQHNYCERDQKVMQEALAAGLPVSQIHAAGTWHDHPVMLLSWLPGRTLADEIRARPWQTWKFGVMFGRMQAAIHSLSAPAILQDHPDAWIDWLGSDEPSLQQHLRTMSHATGALLHLDYHPENVLTDGKSITGVLDWRNSLAGDPRADAARTIAILRIDYIGRPPIHEILVRWVFEQGWRYGYKQQGALHKDMSLFYVWAGAVMERDLAAKRRPEDLARIHRWTLKQKKRAGYLEADKEIPV